MLKSKVFGRGEPLLLIHGMGSASTAWKPLIPLLENEFTIITVDLPGHGESPYRPGQAMDPNTLGIYVLDLMQDLGFPEFHLAGNSLGGWVALEMAATEPARIKSLTALAPAGLGGDAGQRGGCRPRPRRLERAVARGRDGRVAAGRPGRPRPAPAPGPVRARQHAGDRALAEDAAGTLTLGAGHR